MIQLSFRQFILIIVKILATFVALHTNMHECEASSSLNEQGQQIIANFLENFFDLTEARKGKNYSTPH
jgi:hypothetical protein